MSMPLPPPDTRAPGQSGHIADHNVISDALTALESAVGTLQQQTGYPALFPVPVKTAAYTALVSDFVPCDVSAGGFTVKLPQGAGDGARVGVKVIGVSNAAQNVLTVATQGTDVINRTGGNSSVAMILLYQGAIFQYSAALGIWYITGDDLPASAVLPATAAVQALSNGSVIPAPFSPLLATVPVTATGNVTGVILAVPAAGNAEQLTVVNRSAFTVAFAAAATSHVADGTSDVIPALFARTFTYDPGTSLWYRLG